MATLLIAWLILPLIAVCLPAFTVSLLASRSFGISSTVSQLAGILAALIGLAILGLTNSGYLDVGFLGIVILLAMLSSVLGQRAGKRRHDVSDR
jgi:hypothetical protein